MKKQKNGISLIVLVITIIVMIILAGSIILSLSNSGIIDKASEAVDSSNYKQLEQYITSELLLSGWTSGKTINKEELQDISGVNVLDIKSDGKVVPDTWVIEKDGAKLTIYSTGEMVKGEVKLWDGSSSAPELKDGNWYIYTPEQLKFLADVVNGGNQTEGYKIETDTVVYLMNDLDLGARQEKGTLTCGKEWTPIGEDGKVFVGTFEGNHHIIRGVYISSTKKEVGIFGNSHSIKNLTIQDSYIASSEKYVGGIVGYGRAGDIVNCHNVNTLVNGMHNVGGVVGICDGKNIKDCTNTGVVQGKEKVDNRVSNTGGIVGVTYVDAVVDNCQNYGSVSVTGYVVGGIVGNSWENTIVKNCKNYGEVTTSYTTVGGIVGQAGMGGIITKNINMGAVKGLEHVGGIVGSIFGELNSCYNQGLIEGMYNVGGIAGIVGGLANSSIHSCYNKGIVQASANNAANIGGILGRVWSEATSLNMNNNYNIGKIQINKTGVTNVGGVVGSVEITNYTAANNYYLDTTLNVTGNTHGESKTSDNMKNSAFVSLLNTGLTPISWEIRAGENNGYPVLIGLK